VVVLPGSWNAGVRRTKRRSKARNYTGRLLSSDSECKESVMAAMPAPGSKRRAAPPRVGRIARPEGAWVRPAGQVPAAAR